MKYSVITSNYKQLPMLVENYRFWHAQSFKDFEWIIASDEDDQAVITWCGENGIPIVYQHNEGYRLSKILNAAVAIAQGQYLVFVMGDSYPKEDFLAKLDEVVRPERVVNGIRLNVSNGAIISSDWRINNFGQEIGKEQRIVLPDPYRAMTLNGQAMSKALYEKIGGMCEEYVSYGREDWDLNMRAEVDGAELWWANEAIIYHREHQPQIDSQVNIDLFNTRKAKMQASATIEKIKIITDPDRAMKRYQEARLHAQELAEAAERDTDESST